MLAKNCYGRTTVGQSSPQFNFVTLETDLLNTQRKYGFAKGFLHCFVIFDAWKAKPKEMTELQFRKLGSENFACCLIVISTKFSMGAQWHKQLSVTLFICIDS